MQHHSICHTIWYDMRYDMLYWRAPKSWRIASIICRTERNKKRVVKMLETKTEKRRRNGLVIKSVESILSLEGSLWWERFVKRQVSSREWKTERDMDGDGGELTEWEDVVGAWTGKSETETEETHQRTWDWLMNRIQICTSRTTWQQRPHMVSQYLAPPSARIRAHEITRLPIYTQLWYSLAVLVW